MEGKVVANAVGSDIPNGYEILYDNSTLPGMSGVSSTSGSCRDGRAPAAASPYDRDKAPQGSAGHGETAGRLAVHPSEAWRREVNHVLWSVVLYLDAGSLK